jgi:hypothetical protein
MLPDIGPYGGGLGQANRIVDGTGTTAAKLNAVNL